MTLYIAKNGQRLGPYTVAEAQNFLAAGTLQPGDLAWHEGQANWIPLSQVPGFAGISAAPGFPVPPQTQVHRRPILVWIIFVLTIIGTIFAVLGLIMIPIVLSSNIPMQEDQRKILESMNAFDYAMSAINVLISLTGAILLFLLRRSAFYFYIAGFALGVMMLIYNIVAKNMLEQLTGPGLVGAIIGWMISIAIVGYVWHLHRKGVLK